MPKENKPKKFVFDSAKNQRSRLLWYFQEVSPRLTIEQARQLLECMSPPARILELRRLGYQIDTHWYIEISPSGMQHRNGTYLYHGRSKNAN